MCYITSDGHGSLSRTTPHARRSCRYTQDIRVYYTWPARSRGVWFCLNIINKQWGSPHLCQSWVCRTRYKEDKAPSFNTCRVDGATTVLASAAVSAQW